MELCQRLWRNPGPACLFGSPCTVMGLSHGTRSLAGSRNFSCSEAMLTVGEYLVAVQMFQDVADDDMFQYLAKKAR